jgi:hypothetical protein
MYKHGPRHFTREPIRSKSLGPSFRCPQGLAPRATI